MKNEQEARQQGEQDGATLYRERPGMNETAINLYCLGTLHQSVPPELWGAYRTGVHQGYKDAAAATHPVGAPMTDKERATMISQVQGVAERVAEICDAVKTLSIVYPGLVTLEAFRKSRAQLLSSWVLLTEEVPDYLRHATDENWRLPPPSGEDRLTNSPVAPGDYYRESHSVDGEDARCGWYEPDERGDPHHVIISLKRSGDLFRRRYRVPFSQRYRIIDRYVESNRVPDQDEYISDEAGPKA